MMAFLRFPSLIAAALLAGGIMLFADRLAAQAPGPEAERSPNSVEDILEQDKLKREKAAKEDPAGKEAAKQRAAKRALLRLPGELLPGSMAERGKLLNILYGHLAAAKTGAVAKKIETGIERVWLHSGSATVGVLMSRALAAAKKKDYDDALSFLDHVVKLAPDYAEGWNQRAYVHFKKDDFVRALGDLRRTLALDPNHFKALEGLGQVLREIDEKDAAIEVYERLVQVHPFIDGGKTVLDQLKREVGGPKT